MTVNKWSKKFWVDLAERVGSTFLGALLTLIAMDNVLEGPDWNTTLWPILVLPTLVSLVKGLLANLAAPETGASMIPDAPPGPEVNPEAGYATPSSVLGALGLGLIVLSVLLLVLTLLKVVAVGWLVVVILFVVGLVLLWVG